MSIMAKFGWLEDLRLIPRIAWQTVITRTAVGTSEWTAPSDGFVQMFVYKNIAGVSDARLYIKDAAGVGRVMSRSHVSNGNAFSSEWVYIRQGEVVQFSIVASALEEGAIYFRPI